MCCSYKIAKFTKIQNNHTRTMLLCLELINHLVVACLLCLVILAIALFLLRFIIRYRQSCPEPRRSGEERPLRVAFFHPYCNAGGGGERVLWVAIRALQHRYTNVNCVIYTGDTETTHVGIINKVKHSFNIDLPRDVEFVFLHQRIWVEASRWPYFTLLGQSVGSIILGFEALFRCVPDVYLDTMGYAFTLPLFKYIGGCEVGCYVHYPTISVDMLSKVDDRTEAHNNAAYISQSAFLSGCKKIYYQIFAYLYGVMGNQARVVMVNSTWTQNHILSLWATHDKTHIVYPPCNTHEFLKIPLKKTIPEVQMLVSVAQFRPEKNHVLQIRSFYQFIQTVDQSIRNKYKLVLIGSCRGADDLERVDALKGLCNELDINELVQFRINIPFDELKDLIGSATIGLHSMWNEHFGIGVVECMAAGTIVLAHDSGGPKLDIVVEVDNEKTGFLANTEKTYCEAMRSIFNMTQEERSKMCRNARQSVNRFSDEKFEMDFIHVTKKFFE